MVHMVLNVCTIAAIIVLMTKHAIKYLDIVKTAYLDGWVHFATQVSTFDSEI